MLVTFLVILFSDLTFADISIQGLMQWYNYHPFAFIIAIQDIILGALILFRLFNQFIAFEDAFEPDDTVPDLDDEDSCCPSTWIVYSNDKKDK